MRLLTSLSVGLCAGLVAAACSDPIGVPARSSAPLAALTKSATRVSTYPNSRKYRDGGFRPAAASVGSATISMRALLGASGTTDVEVTTGTFDGGTISGALSSVLVKGYDANGVQLFTSPKNGLSGSTASFPYSNLTRGSRVEVKANVRDVSGSQTEVVTVSDAVHLRPDLATLRVEGPADAMVGMPVNFTAFVMERNGDVGARASCVLYVDGSAVDRADGIWVDAGRVVSCAMTHSFSTAGIHTLEVRAENVRPGDYDDANNGASTSIQIAREFRAFSLQGNSLVEDLSLRLISTLTTLEGIQETWDQTVSDQGLSQFASMTGLVDHKLTFPVAMHGLMVTNGTTLNALDETLATSESAYWFPTEWGASCSTAFGANTNLYICTFDTGYLAGHTSIQYDWWAADVQYHSKSYVTYWDPTCANNLCERYVVNDFSVTGPTVIFGPDMQGRLSVQGADDDVPTAAMATVSLSPFSSIYDRSDPGCATTPVSMSCRESHHHSVGVLGYIEFGSWPVYVP